MFRERRTAITRTQTIIIVVVLLAAVVAGEVALSKSNKNGGGTVGIDLHIYEDNPVLQIDHFYADTIYVPLGANISLAVQNGDDETRVFTLKQFNINVTIYSGTTAAGHLHCQHARQLLVHLPHNATQPRERREAGPMPRRVLRSDAERDAAVGDRHGDGCGADAAQAAAAAAGPIGSCNSVRIDGSLTPERGRGSKTKKGDARLVSTPENPCIAKRFQKGMKAAP